MFKKLKEFEKKNSPLLMKSRINKEGIKKGRYYAFMGTVSDSRNRYKLVKIRDVSGEEYTGFYRKSSSFWKYDSAQDLKNKAKPQDLNDGTFYLPAYFVRYYLNEFYEVDYSSDVESSATVQQDSSQKVIEHNFNNPSQQDVDIEFEVDPSFLFPEGCSKRDFSTYLYVYNEEGTKLKYSWLSKTASSKQISLKNLPAGNYMY